MIGGLRGEKEQNMRYSGSLAKDERAAIFKLFLDNHQLKFSEIEKAVGIRSNMVSYHLEQMQKEGLIEKEGLQYILTKNAERYIPIFSNLTGAQLSPLPVVLVATMQKSRKDRILLMKRNKRPYKDHWSLIGGKMMLEESFEDAAKRLVKEKSGLAATFLSMNSVFHERVKEEGFVKHSFILFFVKAAVPGASPFKASEHGPLRWFAINDLAKERVIPSDRWLIEHALNSRVPVKSAYLLEEDHALKLDMANSRRSGAA